MTQLVTLDQRMFLADAIQQAFPTVPDLTLFLVRLGHKSTDEFAQGSLPQIIDAILTTYEAKGRAKLLIFLEKLTKTPNEELAGIAEGVIADLPPRPFFEKHEHHDPAQALFPRDEAFLDRDHIRLHIAALRTMHGVRTLILNGPSMSGKTHTYELVRHVATAAPPFRYLYIDLRTDMTPGYNAGQFMKSISYKMKLDLKDWPVKQAQTSTWVQELRDWFIGALNDRKEMWWLVIDGMSQVEIAIDIRELISSLVGEAEKNTDNLRLVLIGCADDAIEKSGSKVVAESLAAPGPDEIATFIRIACSRAKATAKDADIERAVGVVMAGLPKDPRVRLRTIAERAGKAAQSLMP